MDRHIDMNNMIKSVLIRMKYTGCNPFSKSRYAKYWMKILFSINVSMIIMQTYFFLQYKKNYGDNFSTFVVDFIGFCANLQINYKLYMQHVKKNILLSLYNKMVTKFWTVDETYSPEFVNKVGKIYKLTKFVSNVYSISMLCTFYGYALTCPLKNQHYLTVNMWLPKFIEENYLYLIMFSLFQIVTTNISVISGLMTFDIIFLCGIAHGVVQLKLLKYKLMSIGSIRRDAKLDFQVIAKCVKHHVMLFEYFDEIDKLSSSALLNMLVTNTIYGGIVLFAFKTEDDINLLIAYVSLIISVIGQFYMYCLLGQFIQTETESVADAAYEAKWENIPDRNVRFGILLIIQRSQKYSSLSIGGFMDLCLENFTAVARMILSLVTFILNMREE